MRYLDSVNPLTMGKPYTSRHSTLAEQFRLGFDPAAAFVQPLSQLPRAALPAAPSPPFGFGQGSVFLPCARSDFGRYRHKNPIASCVDWRPFFAGVSCPSVKGRHLIRR